MDLLQKLFSSQKFIAMLSGLIGIIVLKVFKVSVDPQTVAEIVALVGAYILGQGIADNGKGAAQVQAIAAVTADPRVNESDTKKAVEEIKKV